MIDRTTKLRWRRRVRRSKQHVEEFGTHAEEGLERHFFRRLSRLTRVRRFVAAWVILFLFMIGGVLYQARSLGKYYLESTPISGGIYTEGILGSFTNANPLYAASSLDNSVATLIFNGLFKFDQKNQLVGELAQSWSVDERGTTYTVRLKPNLKWQDGVALTSADVVYTYQTIQNADAKSPLASSWQGVKVSAPDAATVVFVLPNILNTFPYSMVNGIVPKHKLAAYPASQLRSIAFNTTQPVGAGPFKLSAVEVLGNDVEKREQRLALVPNTLYQGGSPKIDRFIIRSFSDEKQLAKALDKGELSAAAGLSTMTEDLTQNRAVTDYNIPLTSEVMVFLKTSNPILSNQKVRQGLAYATDTGKILANLGRPVLPARSPLLPDQLGYDKTLLQNTNNIQQANKLFDEAGWVMGPKGVRVDKANQPLAFNLVTQSNAVYEYVSQAIKQQWRQVGVDITISLQKDDDLQTTLAFHNYDALLYGIALGPDPDVFAYWHSSQADIRAANRLNFSEYKSTVADKALEGGRTRSDPTIRAIKYRPFLEAWRADVPAIALYQPRYLYAVRGKLAGFSPSALNNASDRYANVQNWYVREALRPKN